MYEELLISDSHTKTNNQKIFQANESFIESSKLEPIVAQMEECIKNYDISGILKILTNNVEGFTR